MGTLFIGSQAGIMLVWTVIALTVFGHTLAFDFWRKPGCHRVGNTRNISIPDCVEFTISTNACRGYCESWSLSSIMLGYKPHPVTSFGQCCNIVETEDVAVRVLCLDGERDLIFKSAKSCACFHCLKD